jgi:uncharacterized double-CXXCG motif protein
LEGTPLANEYKLASSRSRPRSEVEEADRWRRIAPLFPTVPFFPWGVDFGPLQGVARGQFGDFVWPGIGTILIRQEALTKLLSAGLHLPVGVPPQWRYTRRDPPTLLELQLDLHGRWSPAAPPADRGWACPACGYRGSIDTEHIVLDSATIPDNVDIFRCEMATALVFVSERFKETVERLKLTDITFIEIPVL